jgi:GcrA cell cycle regulator
MTNGWTEDRVTLLKKLWTDGLSASQIAKQLGGVTRNAVIGKVHRLGLAGRAAPSRPIKRVLAAPVRPKPVLVAPAMPVVRPAGTAAVTAAAASTAVSKPARPALPARPRGDIIGVLELGAHMCKWPIGDPGDAEFGFCGAQAAPGLPYCAEHAAVAYQPHVSRKPGERREDRAAAEVRRLARLANY